MKVALVTTRGGHLTETMRLLDAFDGNEFFFITPFSSRDQELRRISPVYFFQSIDAHLVKFFFFSLWSLYVLLKEKPRVILSMGPEIAIPFFAWGKLLNMKTIYIESWCRVTNLSLTGKLVYYLVDEFWVQWPQLIQACSPKAKYNGGVI